MARGKIFEFTSQVEECEDFIPLGTTYSIEIHTFSTAHRWTSLGMTSDSALLATEDRPRQGA